MRLRVPLFVAALATAVSIVLILPTCSDAGRNSPAEKQGRTLVTVFAGQSTSDAGIEEMINDLIAKKLPDIRLEWERVSWGDQFQSQMQAKFASGEVPDIMIGKAQDVATYIPSGNLAPVPPSLRKYFDDSSLGSVSRNDVAYGLPYNAFYQGVLYNKDIFKNLGLRIPRTIDEMSITVGKLRAKGITPFAAHFEESWYIGNILMQFAIGDVFSRTPDWGDRFRSGEVSFADSKAFLRACAQLKDILAATWPDALSTDQSECDERFADGEAAMYLTGSWSLQAINSDKTRFGIGIFPYPNQTGDAKLIFEPNMTFMKSSKTTHSEAVDSVLQAIFENRDLAGTISDFTKTSSMIKNANPDVALLIQPDIDQYAFSGRVIDATIGNTQLIWAFQAEVASRLDEWLRGARTLQSVFEYADQNRALSAP